MNVRSDFSDLLVEGIGSVPPVPAGVRQRWAAVQRAGCSAQDTGASPSPLPSGAGCTNPKVWRREASLVLQRGERAGF